MALFLNGAKQNLGGLFFTIEILSLFVDKCILWQLDDTFMGKVTTLNKPSFTHLFLFRSLKKSYLRTLGVPGLKNFSSD